MQEDRDEFAEQFAAAVDGVKELKTRVSEAFGNSTPAVEAVAPMADALVNVMEEVTKMIGESRPLPIIYIDEMAVRIFDAIERGLRPTPAGQGSSAIAEQAAEYRAHRAS